MASQKRPRGDCNALGAHTSDTCKFNTTVRCWGTDRQGEHRRFVAKVASRHIRAGASRTEAQRAILQSQAPERRGLPDWQVVLVVAHVYQAATFPNTETPEWTSNGF